MAASSSDWPVHQLWPPSGDKRRTELDVLLFHGLQLTASNVNDAWTSTWTQRDDDNVCWPREWLAHDLGKDVCILSVSYDAHVRTSPHGHISEIADNLFQNLMDRRYKWQCPIILIGHSFGGLVLKSLVIKLERELTIRRRHDSFSKAMSEQAKVFLRNVRGVAFYAVPHAGSKNLAEHVNKLNIKHRPGIMDNIEPGQRDMNQLSVDFDRIVIGNKIIIYGFGEGRPMEQMGILVDYCSAQQLARDNCYKIEDANHMEVCKPPSKEHSSYRLLLQFINTCQEVARGCEQTLQEIHDLPQTTFGLQTYVKTLETLLTSEGSDAGPRYVGVWGMGGVGKTLLLRTLYANAQVHDHFQGVTFIRRTVGKTHDIMALYRGLSEELGLEPELNVNEEDYKSKLHSMFIQKRVFLVLDDIWQDKVFDSLDVAKGKGSVTLLSTRNQSLFERASPQIRQVHMTCLLEKDSWSLFCVHAFGSPSNVPDELKEVAESMAQECEGLPLALKVIGGAMFREALPEQWNLQLKRLRESRLQERTVEEKLYERLKVGYDLLSEDDLRLKKCFHYFAAFPEKSNIVFEEILFHWIGERLVPEHYEDDPRADALSLLKKLWQRSFIVSNGQFDSAPCYLLNFKVHDVMRDLALYLLKKDYGTSHAKQLYLYHAGQNLEEISQELEEISEPPQSECTTILEALRLSLDTNNFKTVPKFYAPKLVFLLLGRNPIISLPADFSSCFPKLNVLNLRNGQFPTLPDELGDLINLVCLDLSNCHELEILPDTIRKLQKLKFLILDDCWGLEYLPSGIVDLISLQVLHTAHCVRLTWGTLSLMAKIAFGNSYPTAGASLEDLCRLRHLTELTISASEEYKMELPEYELPLNISSLTKLRLLQVCLEIRTFPADISYRCIQLQELELCSSTLKILPSSFTARGAFPVLIKLNLSCPNLVQFPEVDEGAFPNLQTLDMSGCKSLTSLPLQSLKSLKALSSLRSLIVVDCEWYISEISSTWEKQDISINLSKILTIDWRNTRRYTFGSDHNFGNLIVYLNWKKADAERKLNKMIINWNNYKRSIAIASTCCNII